MTDIKRLLAEATPLPWRTFDTEAWKLIRGTKEHDNIAAVYHGENDRALIVAAVNAVPDYEAAVDALADYLDWQDDPKAMPSRIYRIEDAMRDAVARLRGAA